VRVKDVNVFELTHGLTDALSASLDSSYLEYIAADSSRTSTKEAERRIAAIPEEKRFCKGRVFWPASGIGACLPLSPSRGATDFRIKVPCHSPVSRLFCGIY